MVVDTDLAFDDIMGLLYLLRRDDVTVDAVTLAGTGEAHCDPGVRNAQGLLALGGAPDTPVACGRETPLEGTNAFPDEWRTAADDLSMLDLPGASGEPDPRGAVQVLLEELEGETTLVSLGPLTNVAEALRADPSLADRVPTYVAMAGQVDAQGNAPGGVAEYNVWVDPTAANEVVEGMDVTLVPLDATDDVPFTRYFADTLAEAPSTPEADAVAAMIEANPDFYLGGGAFLWDPLAAALAIGSGLASWVEAPLVVATKVEGTEGKLHRSDEGTPTRFASAVPDPLAFEREYLSVLTGTEIDVVRPNPTMTVSFDGERCDVEPAAIAAGTHDVAFGSEVAQDPGAVLLRTDVGPSYEELTAPVGSPGSEIPVDDPDLRTIEQIASVTDMTRVDISEGSIVAVCYTVESSPNAVPRAWLSDEVPVG